MEKDTVIIYRVYTLESDHQPRKYNACLNLADLKRQQAHISMYIIVGRFAYYSTYTYPRRLSFLYRILISIYL